MRRSPRLDKFRAMCRACALCALLLISARLAAEDSFRPKPGEFPPPEEAKAYRGELVFVDHVNRRGSLRLHVDDHFHEGRLHHFAMLPYGIIRYRGAPAELRDIPLGTVLYGRFYLPPSPTCRETTRPRRRRTTQFCSRMGQACASAKARPGNLSKWTLTGRRAK